MLAICRIFVILALLASQGFSSPVPETDVEDTAPKSSSTHHSLVRRKKKPDGNNNAGSSSQPDYKDFQISSGNSGNARERAIAVFLTPSNLQLSKDFVIEPESALKGISNDVYKAIKSMAGQASKNEENFNKAITKAKNKEEKAMLTRGKISNKVLKILGHLLYSYIDKAKGKGGDDIPKETKKLKTNIATDTKDAGKAQKSYLDTQQVP